MQILFRRHCFQRRRILRDSQSFTVNSSKISGEYVDLWNKQLPSIERIKAEAPSLGATTEDMEDKLLNLTVLLPDLLESLELQNPAVVARCCRDVDLVTQQLILLRGLFPRSDVSRMVVRSQLWLLYATPNAETLSTIMQRFEVEFPEVDVERLLAGTPWLLDLDDQRHLRFMDHVFDIRLSYFDDCNGITLSDLTIRDILICKESIVKELTNPDVTHFDRIVTMGSFRDRFKF